MLARFFEERRQRPGYQLLHSNLCIVSKGSFFGPVFDIFTLILSNVLTLVLGYSTQCFCNLFAKISFTRQLGRVTFRLLNSSVEEQLRFQGIECSLPTVQWRFHVSALQTGRMVRPYVELAKIWNKPLQQMNFLFGRPMWNRGVLWRGSGCVVVKRSETGLI